MLKNLVPAILLFFWYCPTFSQSYPNYPKYYFRNPLDIPMDLTANFGELRPNHWHMGLDMRTAKKENLPVYAAAAGYIAKIRIESSGFGRCIYINHPNGLTTLYGHLNDFFPALEKYITEQQYRQQTWAIELNFTPQQFPVFKSQLIAYSGNSGSSQGPHLHFEIRDTKSGKCLDPLLFGFPMKDEVKPEILKLAVYDRSRSVYDQQPLIFTLKKTENGYIIPNIEVLQTGWKKLSFAIHTLDRMKSSGSEDGIYRAKIYFDEKPQVSFVLDSIDYNETVYMNAQIDYPYRYNKGVYLQHLSLLPGDKGIVYKKINGNGILNLDDSDIHAVLVEVEDSYFNKSLLSFNIQFRDSLSKIANATTAGSASVKFVPNIVNKFVQPDFEWLVPENGLYDTVKVFYSRKDSVQPVEAVSALHQIGDPSIPVHSNALVRIKPNKEIPAALKNKILIRRNDNRSSNMRKAEWDGAWMTARFGDFGSFQAFIDTVPPQLKDPKKGDTLDFSSDSSIIIEPQDNYGSLRNFRAEIDGQWIRFTNDKGRYHIYKFDERCPYGVHQLKITVEDLAGNSTTKTWVFKRNPYSPPQKKPAIHKKTQNTGNKKTTTSKNKRK
jgi:hypothetical protein